jgi:UMF1 family MFS transporter
MPQPPPPPSSRAARRAVWGWAIYDWANSAFATSVMAGFFPIFFKEFWSAGTDVNVSTALLGYANSLASLIVAVGAPLMGALADRTGRRKRWLLMCAFGGALATAGLFGVGPGHWGQAVALYAAATVGFAGANIFYDSLLPSVAPDHRLEAVSSLGYAMGYLGGGLLFLLNVSMTIWPAAFGLPDSAAAVRWSFVLVAIWWAGFTTVTARWVPEPLRTSAAAGPPDPMPVSGWRQAARTFRSLGRQRNILFFLLAYWFYIDGVDTIIRMAVDYGLSLGFTSRDLILALLMVQFIGFPAALVFGRLGERWGVRRSLFLGIGAYMLITMAGAAMTHRNHFFALAAAIGCFQGGIQALSRSYYARLIPRERAAEYFGIYNMMGKFAAILGPALMGTVGLAVRRLLMPPDPSPEQLRAVAEIASRAGILAVLVLFVAGALLLYLSERPPRRPTGGAPTAVGAGG